jgi:pimeloyl-ACP methyl ester carboxylesterase
LRHFTASDGVRIAYRDEGAGRPILFLHGLMAHGGFFARQQPLAARFRLVTLDLRGHGQSRGEGLRPSMSRLADDVAELMEALELDDVIGVGWSLGASLLWRLLEGDACPRFAGGVIVDMSPCVQNGEGWTLGLAADHCAARSAAIARDFAGFAGSAGQAIFAGDTQDGEWAAAEFRKNDPGAIGAIWASLTEDDYRQGLGDIRQPVLILHGAHSHLYGTATADYLATRIPDARRIQFFRAGHTPHMEQPDLFNRVLTEFAASLPRSAIPQTC